MHTHIQAKSNLSSSRALSSKGWTNKNPIENADEINAKWKCFEKTMEWWWRWRRQRWQNQWKGSFISVYLNKRAAKFENHKMIFSFIWIIFSILDWVFAHKTRSLAFIFGVKMNQMKFTYVEQTINRWFSFHFIQMNHCLVQCFLCYHSSVLHMDICPEKKTVGLSAVIRYDCFLRQLNVMVKMRRKQISEEFHWLSRNIKSMNWRTVLCVDLNGKCDCKLKHERKEKSICINGGNESCILLYWRIKVTRMDYAWKHKHKILRIQHVTHIK